MTRDDIAVKLRELVEQTQTRTRLDIEIGEDTAFADLKLDSFAMLELVYEVEEAFNIEIEDRELADLRTVGQLLTMVEGKIASRA